MPRPCYEGFRPGHIRHSHAEISKAIQRLSYAPRYSVDDGLVCGVSGYWA